MSEQGRLALTPMDELIGFLTEHRRKQVTASFHTPAAMRWTVAIHVGIPTGIVWFHTDRSLDLAITGVLKKVRKGVIE